MRIEKDANWIDLDFSCYATDEADVIFGLWDVRNAVSVQLDFELDGDWGSCWYEYVTTQDLACLHAELQAVLDGRSGFAYTAACPYGDEKQPFFTLSVSRFGEDYMVTLTAYHLGDPLSVQQRMNSHAFLTLTEEFADIAKRFPPR